MKQQELPGFNQEPATSNQEPVTCLGLTFPNDEERRKHFLGILREKLKNPEFRKIEGFHIGSDEDILALSDPLCYTACPNPFIEDFIRYYGKPYDPETDNYRREPFASDTGAGKTHPIYTALSTQSSVLINAAAVLQQLDEQLDKMLAEWTAALISKKNKHR